MASDKSLAAEIEAVMTSLPADQRALLNCCHPDDADLRGALSAPSESAAAALWARAFEAGERSMRERAKIACLDYSEACLEHGIANLHHITLPKAGDAISWADAALGCARLVEALPLQPEGERSDA